MAHTHTHGAGGAGTSRMRDGSVIAFGAAVATAAPALAGTGSLIVAAVIAGSTLLAAAVAGVMI